MISIETTTKLLKLHLQWPDRKRWNAKEDEAIEYFKWLFLNHHDRPEVMEIEDVNDIDGFLARNKHVLWPSRTEEEKWANLRLEPRIENDVNVEMTVTESKDKALIGRVVNGRSLDIGLHGMRVAVTDDVPAGALVSLNVSSTSNESITYTLTAELRWSTHLDEGYLVGVKLIENDEFTLWQTNFGKDFVAPKVGRRRRA